MSFVTDSIDFVAAIECGTLDEFYATSGSVGVTTSHYKTGARALSINPASSQAYVDPKQSGIYYMKQFSLHFKIVSMPGSAIYFLGDSGALHIRG
jgi:hypothetical protein